MRVSTTSPQPNALVAGLFIFLGGISVLGFIVAVMLLREVWGLSEREELVRTLPQVGLVAPGERAILDGKIARFVPPLRAEFVVYRRESKTHQGWKLVDQKRQRLTVRSGDTNYTIANADYDFDQLINDWTDGRRLDEPATPSRNAIDIEGLTVMGPIMAIGRLEPQNGKLVFKAERIVGVLRDEYVRRLIAAANACWSAIGWMLPAGFLGTAISFFALRRIYAR